MYCSSAPARASMRSPGSWRSEEHTSELQSRQYPVCRLLLEKKKLVPYPVVARPLLLPLSLTLLAHPLAHTPAGHLLSPRLSLPLLVLFCALSFLFAAALSSR